MHLMNRIPAWGFDPSDRSGWLLLLFVTVDLAIVVATILTELG